MEAGAQSSIDSSGYPRAPCKSTALLAIVLLEVGAQAFAAHAAAAILVTAQFLALIAGDVVAG